MKQKTRAQSLTRNRDPAKRTVVVSLSRLGFAALTGEGRNDDSISASTKMERAIRHYLADRDAARSAWLFPTFLRGNQAEGEVELELSIDADLWRSFEIEVGRQDVSFRQLLDHAAFYFATDVKSGRVTQRILDNLE